MRHVVDRAGGVRLQDVLPEVRGVAGDDSKVYSCCSDSRQCQPGDLFVALVGSRHDGHDFAREAVERGATAILSERLLPAGVPNFVVSDSREAFGQLCHELAGQPSRHLRVIGVSGTHGKTTSSMLLAAALSAAGRRVGVTTSLGCDDSVESVPPQPTTLNPPVLASRLARMLANGCDDAIVEISSRALAKRRTAGLQLDAAVLTNIRRNHLDLHGSVLNYRNAKKRLFEHLKPGGVVAVNADDPASQPLLAKVGRPLITFGLRSAAELTAVVVERHLGEQTFLLNVGNQTVPVRTRIIGDQHVYNCLSAVAVGLVWGLDLASIVRGIESLDSVPGRLERLECGQPFGVFVDQASTADRLALALKVLRQVTRGKLICVCGASTLRDRESRPLLGRVVERSADVRVITGDSPANERPLEVVHDILDGFDRPARAQVMPDRAKAISWALEQANSGDVVLLAGGCPASGRGWQRLADDGAVARDWLYRAGVRQIGLPKLQQLPWVVSHFN